MSRETQGEMKGPKVYELASQHSPETALARAQTSTSPDPGENRSLGLTPAQTKYHLGPGVPPGG